MMGPLDVVMDKRMRKEGVRTSFALPVWGAVSVCGLTPFWGCSSMRGKQTRRGGQEKEREGKRRGKGRGRGNGKKRRGVVTADETSATPAAHR